MSNTVYKLANGTRCPGVTTFVGILNKPALVKWANNLGLQGINSTKFVDELANAGILAHDMAMAYFQNQTPDLSRNTEYEVELAWNSYASFRAWAKLHTIEPILIETPLVSEMYKFGGTPDLLATVDGVATLVDFKTGKAIYPEHFIQVAAYRKLLLEHDYAVDEVQILRIGRSEDEGYEVKPVKALEANWELFTHCQAVYELQKQLRREK